MQIKIIANDRGNPPGKLADAEIHFTEGPLAGLKLIGFGIWERRQSNRSHNVTFPARQYSVNGERRSFALLRPIAEFDAQEGIRALILEAFEEYTHAADQAAAGALEPDPYATPATVLRSTTTADRPFEF